MLFFVLTVLIYQVLTTQGSYDVLIEDIIVPYYNEKYLTEPDIYIDANHKIFVNFTIIKQFPATAQGHITLKGASLGEFVIDVGFDMSMDFCDLLEEPIIFGPMYQSIGFDPNNCPPPVGVYGVEEYDPPTENFPDNFPSNLYRLTSDIVDQDEKIFVTHIFAKIV